MSTSPACVPNIGPIQRRRRAVGGAVLAVLTVALASYLVWTDAPRVVRAMVFLPAFGASLGIVQARAQTCVALAARATRNMDDGERRIDDAAQVRAIKTQSRRVYRDAVLTAVLATVVALLA